jgi:hypothetical protein
LERIAEAGKARGPGGRRGGTASLPQETWRFQQIGL